MKKNLVVVVVAISAFMFCGCAAAWQSSTYSDDLYSIHNKIDIANRQKAEAELAKAQHEARQAQYEANLAKLKADQAAQGKIITDDANFNGYDAVLADTYESAYARRLYGFSSPTYRMPSSYYTWRYSDAFHYASAYDPAFYNIMVSGDMVWVEPKYITSMFGSWGAVAVPSYGWYYGWNDPYFYWNRPYLYGSCWSWNWGWNYPYVWGWGYRPPHYPHYHHHHHHHPSHRPSHHRPPYVGSGSVGSTGHSHYRPGMVVGRNPGASRPADRTTSVRPQPSNGRTTQPTYRGGSSSSGQYDRGSSTYRGSSSSGSSTYRGGSSSSGSSTYRTPSYSSGGGSRSSYSGGSSHSSYSGGGNVRGR